MSTSSPETLDSAIFIFASLFLFITTVIMVLVLACMKWSTSKIDKRTRKVNAQKAALFPEKTRTQDITLLCNALKATYTEMGHLCPRKKYFRTSTDPSNLSNKICCQFVDLTEYIEEIIRLDLQKHNISLKVLDDVDEALEKLYQYPIPLKTYKYEVYYNENLARYVSEILRIIDLLIDRISNRLNEGIVREWREYNNKEMVWFESFTMVHHNYEMSKGYSQEKREQFEDVIEIVKDYDIIHMRYVDYCVHYAYYFDKIYQLQ